VNAQLGSGTASGRVPIKFSITDGAIAACGVPKASNPEFYQQLMRDFETATTDSLEEFEFRIELASYSQSRASASWLRSAYLAFFSVFGYRFICRQEMKAVREHIKKPEHSRLTFRLHRSEESAPLLLRIEEPRTFRSYAMFYGHNVVFLPRYGDLALYERLTEHSGMSGIIRAKAYPWPSDGPLHTHDHLVSA
jgi:hypothetical protein